MRDMLSQLFWLTCAVIARAPPWMNLRRRKCKLRNLEYVVVNLPDKVVPRKRSHCIQSRYISWLMCVHIDIYGVLPVYCSTRNPPNCSFCVCEEWEVWRGPDKNNNKWDLRQMKYIITPTSMWERKLSLSVHCSFRFFFLSSWDELQFVYWNVFWSQGEMSNKQNLSETE